MRILLCFLLLALLNESVHSAARIALDDYALLICALKESGVHPHPKNCRAYVNCEDGSNGTIQTCESHHNFHPDYKICVWEEIYSCQGKVAMAVEKSVMISFCRDKEEGVYPDPQRCNRYIICSKVGTYHMKCSNGFRFNPEKKKCEEASKVKCNETVFASLFPCEGKSPGRYAADGSCDQYYICKSDGKAVLKDCPRHKNFHPKYKICVWSYSYSCNDPKFCDGKADGYYANPNNCYGYYECADNRTFPRNCDPSFRFNGSKCVDPSHYICPEKSRIHKI